MKKRLVIALALLVLLSTYKPQELSLTSKFNIKEIKIENNHILKDEDIKKDLIFLYDTNLIFLNNSNIKLILKSNNLIQSFEVKKIYPNKIKIKIFEKKPIVILQHKKKKFYISETFDLINFSDLDAYKNLPIVFGKQKDFKILYQNLQKINFPLEEIKKYYLYESKRWDLETDEKKIIKLSPENYIKSLENFISLRKENNFDKYSIYDYRISDQLILK
jgi:cell division septal protein FtsQ